jgi:glycosyltransferase involved in cell wall biosynthesis
MTRVSIITPSLNQAQYLEKTIQSVLDQQHPDLEYMIVDGGSTDGSVEIIHRYESHLTWWVSEPDCGQSDAINKGLRRATGDIVAWLNSDDLYAPGAISKVVEQFQRHPDAGLVFGDVLSIDAGGVITKTMRFGGNRRNSGKRWSLDDLMMFNIISQPGVFMNPKVLEQAGYLDLNFHYLMDHHLWLRMAAIAPMVYVPEVFASARFHPAAKNVAQAAHFRDEAFSLIKWMDTQPSQAAKMSRLRKRVLAGAHCFSAYYLQDAGQSKEALKAYVQAWKLYPPIPLRQWKRFAFIVLTLMGFKAVTRDIYNKFLRVTRK